MAIFYSFVTLPQPNRYIEDFIRYEAGYWGLLFAGVYKRKGEREDL